MKEHQMKIDFDPGAIAKEFLDQWEKAHNIPDGEHPNYDRLRDKFPIFTGVVSIGEADAVQRELHSGRKARGWPDPTPGTIMPSIEGAIMALWITGMRNLGRREDETK